MSSVVQGLERIPDSLGLLVMNEDGAVVSSSGELENDEKIANQLMNLVRTAIKVPTSSEQTSSFRRLSVIWDTFMYVITISNHRVYVCKRQHLPQEPAMA